jgi:hypothetical protein
MYVCDYRRYMDWWIHSELQVIIALSLISTLYKSPQHLLSNFPACCVFTSRSLVTASNSGDSSASRAQVLQPPMQNSTLNWQLTRAHIKSSLHSRTSNSLSLSLSLSVNWQLAGSVRVSVTLRLAVYRNQFVLSTSPLRLIITIFSNRTLALIVLM